jgi:hypothetical protein
MKKIRSRFIIKIYAEQWDDQVIFILLDVNFWSYFVLYNQMNFSEKLNEIYRKRYWHIVTLAALIIFNVKKIFFAYLGNFYFHLETKDKNLHFIKNFHFFSLARNKNNLMCHNFMCQMIFYCQENFFDSPCGCVRLRARFDVSLN